MGYDIDEISAVVHKRRVGIETSKLGLVHQDYL